MPDIDPFQLSLKPYRKVLDDPHQADFMALVDGDHGVEKLLDLVLGFGEDHGWTNDYLEDHCFVAHYLKGTQLVLNDYPGDDPVPAPLDCLLRVMKILALQSR